MIEKPKPTIAELERILDEAPGSIEILPDGSVKGIAAMTEQPLALDVILNGIKNAKDEDGGELWMPVSWATREGAAYEIAVSVMHSFGKSDYLLVPCDHFATAAERDRLRAMVQEEAKWQHIAASYRDERDRLVALNARLVGALKLAETSIDNSLRSAGSSTTGFIAAHNLMVKAQNEARATLATIRTLKES